jgi:hypothetical protein
MAAHIQWLDDDHLFGYLSVHDDEDAPDGAWWAKLEDGVRFYNEQHHTNHDPFDTVHRYIAQKADEDDS